MGGIRRHESPRGVHSKPHVGFADTIVTGVSRPVGNDEHWTLFYFEDHASNCLSCSNPLEVHLSGRRLCEKGHKLAQAVGRLMFRLKSDQHVYTYSQETHQEVRVEIPQGYKHTLGLFKAIDRAMKKGTPSFAKPQSFDANYFVRKRMNPTLQHQPHSWPSHHAEVREPSDKFTHHRGSLYAVDIAEIEESRKLEQRIRYNVEERAPSYREKSRRHSLYG